MVYFIQSKVLLSPLPPFSLVPKRRWFYHFSIFFKPNNKPQNVSFQMLKVLLSLVWGRPVSSSGGAGEDYPSGVCSEYVWGQSGWAQERSWGWWPGLSEDTLELLFWMVGRRHRKYPSGWMNKWKVVCPYHGILLNLKEWSSDPCYNLINLKNSTMPGERSQSQKIFFPLYEISRT